MELITVNATTARNNFFNLLLHSQTQNQSFRIQKGQITSAYLISPTTYQELSTNPRSSGRNSIVPKIKALARKHSSTTISISEYVTTMRDQQAIKWTPTS